MKSKGEAGEHLCSNPPYGYMKDPDNKKHWIVDEEAAKVVRRIFRLCLEGYGPTQIARILKEEKIVTPTVYFMQNGRATRNAPQNNPCRWSAETVTFILEARYVDVRLERKKEVLDAYHSAVEKADPPKAKEVEPKKAKGKAKKKSTDLEL